LAFHPGGAPESARRRISVRTTDPGRIDFARLSDEDIAFLPIRSQAKLIRERKLTSVALTRLYLNRLKLYGDRLKCVVRIREDAALAEARRADAELASGKDRGPLHGIPCGIKDLFQLKDEVVTWGAAPYREQVFTENAAVVERLRAAGAVIVAQLSMGALAQGDIWFGGVTKNPWNEKQGSSGSSAGSASATAAGLVSYAIGTETLGSICSPSVRCRVTGLRPTFGRVSRFGAMELSYTMDKIGPICREVEDCALVLAALIGRDPRDPATVEAPFEYRPRRSLRGIRVALSGVQETDPFAKNLVELGASIRAVNFTPVPNGALTILEAECGSAFEAFTRTGKVRELGISPWPPTFRKSRFIPAVEYLQAQRARAAIMATFEREFADFDVILVNDIGNTIYHTNLTGHPQIVIPQGDDGKGNSLAKSLIGKPYRESELLSIARVAQEATDFHRRRPKLDAGPSS
jgi:Asp-tRNA(Asn)/Glu-tRNA(Gln) amidotransferase A subunit family amidase